AGGGRAVRHACRTAHYRSHDDGAAQRDRARDSARVRGRAHGTRAAGECRSSGIRTFDGDVERLRACRGRRSNDDPTWHRPVWRERLMSDESFHLTPLDIRRYDFGARSFRGYDEKKVEDFRNQVAEELERLTRINQDLDSKARGFHEQLRAFRERDKALNEALVSAQQLRSEIR